MIKNVLFPAAALCMILAATACKRRDPPVLPPASAPAPSAATAAAPSPAIAPAARAETPFDFNSVPEATGTIPPFPYVDYPPKVTESMQNTVTLPMDEVDVILGTQPHRLEGRIAMRSFLHRDAQMSELEVRRNYQNAMKAIGAVKVNVDQPGAHYMADPRMAKLRAPFYDMSYDVYLARKGAARHWIVVMTSDSQTRLLSIEETPFVQTIAYEGAAGPVPATGAPPRAPQPLDINALPVNTAPLPPFPYLAYPAKVTEAYRFTRSASFDAVGFIVGNALRTVEGKVETRTFDDKFAGISQMAARRNYEAALAGLGAVRVDTAAPDDPALVAANGGGAALRTKLHIEDIGVPYASYLVRRPDKNIWLAMTGSPDRTHIVVVDEQVMQQSVALVTADTMRTELAAKGHIALYLNFDTDQATLRADGKPAVDEIAALLKKDPSLKLAVEGHTDNTGDAQHNLTLSRQRADAVVQALVGSGIAHARLQAAGRGAAAPIADNQDEAGRAKNRRVELVKI